MKIKIARIQNQKGRWLSYAAATLLPLLLILGFAYTTLAYGPERQTYTIKKPADKVTFNSIVDNPNYGDERNFVIAKDAANKKAGGWSDEVKVKNGKEYLVRVYVHNNAAENLHLVAKNTRVSVNVPTTYAKSHQIDGVIRADNAQPKEVWDDVVLKGDEDFILRFVGGSARYHNNYNASNGFALPDSIVTKGGAQLGYEKMDGNIPGCFKYSGIVTFRVKVTTRKTPNFNVTKQVRKKGDSKWHGSITANVGDKLEYLLGYDNTGKTVQNNVILRDQVPKGISYVADSSTLKNATNSKGNGKAIGNNSLVGNKGVNIGNYTPGSNAYVYYSAVIKKNDLVCGQNKLVNKVTASTDNGSKSATAEVIVNAECEKKECKPGIPEGDERCEEEALPTELPHTGPAEMIAGVLGVAMVTLGVAYWIRSRREYRKVLSGSVDKTEPVEGTLGSVASKETEAETDLKPEARSTDAENFHKR